MLTVKGLIDQLLLLDPETPVTLEREGLLERASISSIAIATPSKWFGDSFREQYGETIESVREMEWLDDEERLGAREVVVIR